MWNGQHLYLIISRASFNLNTADLEDPILGVSPSTLSVAPRRVGYNPPPFLWADLQQRSLNASCPLVSEAGKVSTSHVLTN